MLFSYLTCHLEDIVIGVLWFHCADVVSLMVRRPTLEVATKRLLHQQVKILGSFIAMFAHRSVPLQLFLVVYRSVSLQLVLVVGIFLRSLGVHWLRHMCSQ